MNLPFLDALTTQQLRAPIWVYDIIEKKMVWANDSALELWEARDLDELCQRDFSADQSQAVHQILLGYIERFKQQEYVDVWWEIAPKGIKKRIFARLSGVLLRIPHDNIRVAMLVEGQFSDLLNTDHVSSAAMAVLFDETGRLISSNPPFVEKFGTEITFLKQILPDETSLDFICSIGSMGCDIELNTLQGMRWHHAEVNIKKDINTPVTYVLTLIDIQERKLRELETANQARTDLLTGLLNRRGLMHYMATHEGAYFSVFYIDLDGFKPINDSHGHNAGDELLRELASVLMNQEGKKICARLGGDEFAVVFLTALNEKQILLHAENLLRDLSRTFTVAENHLVRVSGSIGIASAPQDSADIHELLARADVAMYEAKKLGRNQAVVYKAGMESYMRRRTLIVQYLDAAMAQNRFVMNYQPIVFGDSGDTVLMEALIRWQHPILGSIPPLEFISIAENSGKIARLESWVINQVCQDLAEIRRMFHPDTKISINISGAHINQPDFIAKTLKLLEKNQCQPQDFVLELTESVLVPMTEEHNSCLDELVDMGFQLAIDDFGTGYSSLAYINKLPASYVKIDKAFIDALYHDKNTLLFIRDLCEKFGIQCIAEGVEHEEQKDILNEMNVLLQQGYYFSLPQSLERFSQFSQSSHPIEGDNA